MVFYCFKPRYTIANVVGVDAAQAFTRGMVNQTQGTGSSTWLGTMQGATPYMFRPFTTAYKIYKVVKKLVRPGQQYVFNFLGPRNKTIHMDRYYNVTTSSAMIYGEQDKYRGFLLRATGTPTNSVLAATVVNTAVGALDWTCIEDCQVGWNDFQNYKRYFVTAPTGSFPATTNASTFIEANPLAPALTAVT